MEEVNFVKITCCAILFLGRHFGNCLELQFAWFDIE